MTSCGKKIHMHVDKLTNVTYYMYPWVKLINSNIMKLHQQRMNEAESACKPQHV